MGKKDPRVDAYIAKAADFAKPILNHLRSVVHEACPEVEEDYQVELSALHVQGHVLQHGRVQGALRVRLLEKLADRRQERTKHRDRRWASSGGSPSFRTCRPRRS